MIERAVVIGNGKKITVKDLPVESSLSIPQGESLDDLEKTHIRYILDKYGWNISRAAKALRVDRVTLYNKISRYGLKNAD
jgi:transcriptional regulator of acetoin/glycerol metabolism